MGTLHFGRERVREVERESEEERKGSKWRERGGNDVGWFTRGPLALMAAEIRGGLGGGSKLEIEKGEGSRGATWVPGIGSF